MSDERLPIGSYAVAVEQHGDIEHNAAIRALNSELLSALRELCDHLDDSSAPLSANVSVSRMRARAAIQRAER